MLNKSRLEEELISLGVTPPKIIFYSETDSTNTRAKEYALKAENKETVVFIADSQTAGRGRRGRSFVSEKGAGIYISILTFPNQSGADATKATAKAAVSLSRAIEALTDCEIKIKWVNDLYLGGKKLAGILTEGELREDGKIAYQVVGMGINVYKSAISKEISDIATSLEDQCKAPDRARLSAMIIKEFLSCCDDYYAEYKARSFIIGKKVTVVKLTESHEARVLDINPDFSLLIDRDGTKERLFTGEISLKIDN